MTPRQFSTEVTHAISTCKDLDTLGAAAKQLVSRALGSNAWAYVADIDKLCRALRQLGDVREFSAPTRASIDAGRGSGEVGL